MKRCDEGEAPMRLGWGIALGLLLGPLVFGPATSARSATDRHQTKHASSHVKKRKAVAARHHAHKPKLVDHRPLIIIDPGHGGTDPGAVGVSGTPEKTVTLATALELRRVLEATGRYRIALTRTTDRTVSLADRVGFARRQNADLLIAIHADAARNRHARGASVYVRSGDAAAPLAASAGLQDSMIDKLEDDVRMVPAPARAARFYVLGARSIPSVLLEMGFVSNRQDEALLRQPRHRRVIVDAIKDAVNDYFASIGKGSRT